MKENFDYCLRELLRPDREGGFINHPDDPGGMTNMGVTQNAWSEWVGHSASEKEMRGLTVEKVAPFYKRKYWDKVSGDSLPTGLDHAVFDFAVNSGPGRAAKLLQAIAGVSVDGSIGPKTLAAVQKMHLEKLVAEYNDMRQEYLEALPHYKTFGNGWKRRVAEVKTEALAMLG